jgi:hypothetical protein
MAPVKHCNHPDAVDVDAVPFPAQQGCFFRRHRDNERLDGCFGTLVIQLPSVFQGAELTVYQPSAGHRKYCPPHHRVPFASNKEDSQCDDIACDGIGRNLAEPIRVRVRWIAQQGIICWALALGPHRCRL